MSSTISHTIHPLAYFHSTRALYSAIEPYYRCAQSNHEMAPTTPIPNDHPRPYPMTAHAHTQWPPTHIDEVIVYRFHTRGPCKSLIIHSDSHAISFEHSTGKPFNNGPFLFSNFKSLFPGFLFSNFFHDVV